jgi:hypothetical protein
VIYLAPNRRAHQVLRLRSRTHAFVERAAASGVCCLLKPRG